jgi:hypothetical protein
MKPWKSESDNILPGISEERFMQAAREYARSAYPNPDRTGCPRRNDLDAVARRKRPPSDDEVHHIPTCSPCFTEYEAIRKAWKRKRAFVVAGAIAATLTVAAVSGTLLFRRGAAVAIPPETRSVEISKNLPRKHLIDLRPYERFRGEGKTERSLRPASLILERANLDLTIQLPTGSEEGRYVFELIDSSGAHRIEASGDAVIRDFITTAEVPFDLREVSPGPFTLTVRRMELAVPAQYPVEVR